MQITLYRRSYPIKDAPVSVSFLPFAVSQRHTYSAGGKVYEAVGRELLIVVPDGAKVDDHNNRLVWAGDKGSIKSTASEVFGFAEANVSGFRTV